METARDAVLDYAMGIVRLLPGQAAVTSAVLQGPPAALLGRIPQLVRGFAGERTDGGALFCAAAGISGGSAGARKDAGVDDGRGCVLVQSLPALSRETAGSPMASRAGRLTEAADWLHWELAERPDLPEGAVAERLAARYALCYAGAAILWLWRAGGADRAEWAYEAVDVVLEALEDPAVGVPDVSAVLDLISG
ncbi:hypothetical protein ACIQJ4_18645 [Streptomyces filamentosus]|uniref:hypothetical protein n=1 Tax=Streptomyces filamentosus TaxID=67294 RepID=UPI0038126C0A